MPDHLPTITAKLTPSDRALVASLARREGLSISRLVAQIVVPVVRARLAGDGAVGSPIVDVSAARQAQLRETLRVARA